MICQPCAKAATPLVDWEIELLGGDVGRFDPTHRPEICIDADRTPEDIRLHGRKCTCQHGQRGAMEGNGT